MTNTKTAPLGTTNINSNILSTVWYMYQNTKNSHYITERSISRSKYQVEPSNATNSKKK